MERANYDTRGGGWVDGWVGRQAGSELATGLCMEGGHEVPSYWKQCCKRMVHVASCPTACCWRKRGNMCCVCRLVDCNDSRPYVCLLACCSAGCQSCVLGTTHRYIHAVL